MHVSIIAAVANRGVIGSAGGGIPWDLPRDRSHFRASTRGKWMLVGRRTYEEMDGWFTDQTPLILTEKADYKPRNPSHRVVSSVFAAIDLARRSGAAALLVCGGAGVYAAAIRHADRLVLTRIDGEMELPDPVYFPDFEHSGDWSLNSAEAWPPDSMNPFPMRLERYSRNPIRTPSS